MCGRFALYHTENEIKDYFDISQLPLFDKRFNIAPSQEILCLLDDNGNKKAVMMKWGLIPFWAKSPESTRILINARSETVAEKPAFKKTFKTHRGLVIMSGFFEWIQKNGKKQPYYFKHTGDKPLAIAALWDTWQGESDAEIISCCILTTHANQLMQPIHDRMPVILNKHEQSAWLDHSHYDRSFALS